MEILYPLAYKRRIPANKQSAAAKAQRRVFRVYVKNNAPGRESFIHRGNRDIRFSADKTPYKLHMAAHLNLRGKKAMGFPGVYMEVGAKGGAIAAGSYMPNKEELPALRDLVLHEGADLRAAISTPSFKKLYGELLGEESKILPAEFRDAVTREPLVRKKQFYVWATIPKSVFTSDTCITSLVEYYRTAKTMNDVLARAL